MQVQLLPTGHNILLQLSSSMSVSRLIKFSIVYIAIFGLIHGGLFLGIKNLQKNYNQDNLNKLIFTVSAQRPRYDSPCQNTFAKDPYSPNYYKIYIYCNGSEKPSTNTIDLDAVNDKTVRGVITEFARIMNFDANKLLANNCLSTENGKNVNLDSLAINHDILKCFFQNK